MADEQTQSRRWEGRPALAWAVRVTIFVVPFLAAMTVAFLLSSQLPVASSLSVQVVRWLAIVAVSTVAMMGVDRLARRLLPLSVLLKLTLVFPDHAPSRFGVAMRTGTTAQLRQRLESARSVPSGETQQEAAERLLELVGLLSHHDRLTRGHSERVRAYSHLIGDELGLTEAELDKLRWAALLHDVGKTAIDTAILNKPDRLTAAEYDTIKTHPDEGRALVAPLADWLGESIQAVWQHHERFDGRGYPQGLSGTDISFAARVVTVADSYDVMTSARSYKKPMSAEEARAELAACSGTQFDPIIVRAFLNVSLGRLRLMTGPLAWFAQLALFEPAGVVHASAASTSSGGSGAAGGSVGTAGGAGSAVSSAGGSMASSVAPTAAAAATSAGSAGVASTVAATAASVVASTVGIAAASPVLNTPIASASAPITVAAIDARDDLPAPEDTIVVVEADSLQVADSFDPDADAERPAPASAGSEGSADGVTSESAAAVIAAADSPTGTTGREAAPSATPSTDATTLPPATTTTTTLPSATTTTTTVPAATTSTTTTTTTTTTVVPSPTTTIPGTPAASILYLGDGATGAIPAPAFHGISGSEPLDIDLPNFDVDRDAAAGALVQRDAAGSAGTDPTKVLKFRDTLITPLEIDGPLHVDLFVAAEGFERKDIDVEVGIYRCDAVAQCALLGSDLREVKNAKQWRMTKFHFRGIDATIGVGETIEVRVAVLDSSEADGWFAFGTQEFDSKITVE